MTSAPVGFQCPACVAESSTTTTVIRPSTLPSGGPVAFSARTPVVTWALIGINVLLFLVMLGVGVNQVASQWAMRPLYVASGDWYRLFSSMFLHWNVMHIGFNMLVLFMLGPTLEKAFGHVRFVILYVLAGLGGSVASFMFSPVSIASLGASGAIFGLMGALLVAGKSLRIDVTQILVLIGLNLVIGFLPGGSVDWRAHIGGLVVGALVALIYTRVGIVAGQWAALCLVALVLYGGYAVRSNSIENEIEQSRPGAVTAQSVVTGELPSVMAGD